MAFLCAAAQIARFVQSVRSEARELQRYVYSSVLLPKQRAIEDAAAVESSASIEAMIAEESAQAAQKG